jgi:succinoglycan biosynthesis protein ExoO
VPVKAVRPWEAADPRLPFRRLLLAEEELAPRLREADYGETWEGFRAEFLAQPSLADALGRVLSDDDGQGGRRETFAAPRRPPEHERPRAEPPASPARAPEAWEPAEVKPAGVSVAIPNWNHEYVLPRAVESALRAVELLRTRGVPAEVIVADDGSRDGSLVLLRQLEALHYGQGLRVLALSRNAGLPAVRNLLLERASHPYVAFMDADNELVPGNLYHFARAMAQTRAAAVYGNLVRRGAGGHYAMVSSESFQDRVLAENYIDAFALFDRAQVLDAGGYSRSELVRAREDWELYLHLAACGRKVVFVPLVFGLYHAMPGSMIEEANDSHPAQKAHVRRAYDQLGVRQRLPMNTRHLRYHPDLGYL